MLVVPDDEVLESIGVYCFAAPKLRGGCRCDGDVGEPLWLVMALGSSLSGKTPGLQGRMGVSRCRPGRGIGREG